MERVISRGGMIAVAAAAVFAWAGVAQAAPESFSVQMTGAQEVPAVDSSATGTANITYDPATRVVTWNVTYSGITDPATMSHFHGPADPGKNAAPVVWLTTKGTPAPSPFAGQATLTPEQAAQFTSGQWYVNVHSKAHPGGEIRGQIVPPKG